MLDKGAANQLIESVCGSEDAHASAIGIEDREANLVVDVTGQDGLVVDHGNDFIEDDGGLGVDGVCGDESQQKGADEGPCSPTHAAEERHTDGARDSKGYKKVRFKDGIDRSCGRARLQSCRKRGQNCSGVSP